MAEKRGHIAHFLLRKVHDWLKLRLSIAQEAALLGRACMFAVR
jgi:hypothetical protein